MSAPGTPLILAGIFIAFVGVFSGVMLMTHEPGDGDDPWLSVEGLEYGRYLQVYEGTIRLHHVRNDGSRVSLTTPLIPQEDAESSHFALPSYRVDAPRCNSPTIQNASGNRLAPVYMVRIQTSFPKHPKCEVFQGSAAEQWIPVEVARRVQLGEDGDG